MTVKEASIVVSLAEGVTEGVAEEISGGVITRSENTRLTKLKGSTSRRPLLTSIASYTTRCNAIIPGGRDSFCAYFPNGAHQRLSGAAVEPVVATATGTAGANAYSAYPIVDSGAVGGGLTGLAPATCFDSGGRQWFVSSKIVAGTTLGLFVSVIDNGIDVVTPRVIHTQSAIQLWCGVTATIGGVIVWYESAAGISARIVTLGGSTLTVGAAVVVYTPLEPSGYLQADVTTVGTSSYLLCRSSASASNLVLLKVTNATLAVAATATFAGVVANTSPPVYLCATAFQGSGSTYVAVASSDGAGVTMQAVVNAATMVATWTVTGAGQYGAVSCLPWVLGATSYVVFAQQLTGTTIGVNGSAVIFTTRTLASPGTAIGTGYVYWYGLQGKGGVYAPSYSASDLVPYWPLFARWGAGGAPPTVAGGAPTFFMDTASIEIVTPFSPTVYTPVGRCGVDMVSQYSSILYNSSCTAVSSGGRLAITYIVDRYDQPSSANLLFAARYAVFDLEPEVQPSYAVDSGGVGVIGASGPAVWDGIETTEYAPFHRPKIQVNTSGGTGPNLTGTIWYTAVVSWRDAAGNVRRSAPALPFPVTLAGTKPEIYVTMPLTMRQGERQELFDISIYSTVAGGTPGSTFWATDALDITRGTVGCWRFAYIYAAVPGDVVLYSLGRGGEQLLPECPPPIWDVRSISGRLWVIDAENRYRLLPSMLKQDGIAFEFNSNLQIVGFDQQYGKLVAIADVNGSPVAFAERGIWQVDGYGPDNSGTGDTFVDPRLVSNMGCRARHTVAQIPSVGVMFQANDGRFCLMSGGFKRFETFGVYEVQAPTVHLLENEVIYPLTNGLGYVVYNWIADAWTHWPTSTNTSSASATLQNGDHSRTYQAMRAGPSTTSLTYLDSDSIDASTTRAVTIERGWIVPENPQGDCVIRELWVHALHGGGSHSVTVTAFFDYDDSGAVVESVERTWTAAEIRDCIEDGKYTLSVNCHATPSRAVKVLVVATPVADAESVGNELMQALSITVYYGASPGPRRRTLLAAALK